MTVRKIFGKLHLWLGLPTGFVVFIIGLTGAIYCFAPELEDLQSYRHVEIQNRPFLPPSQIKKIASQTFDGKTPQRIYYGAKDRSVLVLFSKKDSFSHSVFINPYNGKVLKHRDNEKDFLSVVLQIHRTLLIPYGQEIISWSTVIFIFMMMSGLILWWPKTRRAARQGFRIRWKASPKRLNYDLHKVLGFYVTWIVIISALSGLMFAFEGFANFTYKLTGAERSIVQKKPPDSDTAYLNKGEAIDLIWQKFQTDLYNKYQRVMFVFPAVASGPILVRANPDSETLYKSDFRYFDQYTGQEFPGSYLWGRYKDASQPADYIRRMNYDIHTGAIAGLPGKITLFFAALIVASLPVTGFLFWWGRKFKAKRKRIPLNP